MGLLMLAFLSCPLPLLVQLLLQAHTGSFFCLTRTLSFGRRSSHLLWSMAQTVQVPQRKGAKNIKWWEQDRFATLSSSSSWNASWSACYSKFTWDNYNNSKERGLHCSFLPIYESGGLQGTHFFFPSLLIFVKALRMAILLHKAKFWIDPLVVMITKESRQQF